MILHRSAMLAMIAAGHLAAQDDAIVGPRSLGMGGTGVSTCDDHTAQYYNPAMLGFFGMRADDGSRLGSDNNDLGRKHWGLGVDASVGYTVLGRLPEIIDEINGANLRGIAQNGLTQPGDLQGLATVARAISELDQSGNAISGDANAGVGIRIGRWGFGARINAEAIGYVTNADLLGMALSASGAALAGNIAGSGAPTDGQVALLGSEQARGLYDKLGGDPSLPIDTASAAWQAVERIDYAMRQAGVSSSTVTMVYQAFVSAADGTGTSLEDNATVLSLVGFGVLEIPVSYGFPINDHWAVGATVKGMVGRVYRNDLSVFSNSAKESLFHTFEYYQESYNLGVDVSVAARTEYLQAGLIIRNLNSPSFESPVVNGRQFHPVVLRPQATFSESVIPWYWMTMAVDIDLNSVETLAPGQDVQRLGAGIELNPWHAVALRAGAYRNLAASDQGSVFTLGAGVNLWAVRIDAALAASPSRVDVLDWSVPEQMRASIGVMADF